MIKTREYTNKILEAVDGGVFSPTMVMEAALNWMSEDDVKEICERYEWFDVEDDDEEIEDE